MKFFSFLIVIALLEKGTQLGDQMLVGRNMGQKSFRNEHSSEILSFVCSSAYQVGDSVDDVGQGFTSECRFFWDQSHIWMGLKSAFERKMWWILTHESNEVPILDCWCTVGQHIADLLRVHFWDSVESKRTLEELMSDVAVMCWRNHANIRAHLVLHEVFC